MWGKCNRCASGLISCACEANQVREKFCGKKGGMGEYNRVMEAEHACVDISGKCSSLSVNRKT